MTHNKELEIKGETVEEAVSEGLSTLGLDRSEVEVVVVDEGRKGFLGLGNREALVRLVPLASDHDDHETENHQAPTNNDTVEDVEVAEAAEEEVTVFEEEFDDLDALPDPELLEEEEIARDLTVKLLEQMGVEATVQTQLSEPDDLGKQVVELNIEGDDLQALIGRNGSTLADLQFVARLMVSQQLRRRVDFVIDVDGYRRKREEGLTRLAERMAQKVVSRQRPVTLEPMTPYDRRLIHMALRDHKDVYTKSIGSGNDRRVRIWPQN